MMAPEHIYARLGQLVSTMSLAVYQAQTQELDQDALWAAMGEGCSAIADLAEQVNDDLEAEA